MFHSDAFDCRNHVQVPRLEDLCTPLGWWRRRGNAILDLFLNLPLSVLELNVANSAALHDLGLCAL
jgi:hypothetical protein